LKNYLTALFLLLIYSAPASAAAPTITSLLEGLKKQPDIEASALNVKAADMQLKQAHAELYPTVSAFGSYTSFNSPTNLRPMTPTEVNIAAGDSRRFNPLFGRDSSLWVESRDATVCQKPLFPRGQG